MTDDHRRAQRARASDLALAPPANTLYPATVDQLRLGWPLVWNNAFMDAGQWVATLERKGLPADVRACLDAIRHGGVTLPAALTLVQACERHVYDRDLAVEVYDAVEEIAARARFIAAWLGDYASSCIVMHACDVASISEPDEAKKRALSVTASEFSYYAHQQALGLYRTDVPVHRKNARDTGWLDLCARAEVVEFMRGVDANPPLGAVRDDTSHDPRDEDFDRAERVVADLLDEERPATAGAIVFPRGILDSIGKGENRKEVERALGKRLGALLPGVAVPEDWNAWEAELNAEAPWLAPVTRALRASQGGRSHWGHAAILTVGPAGAGKSRHAGRIAAVSGLPFGRYALDTTSDNALGGTSIRWSSSHHGFVEGLLSSSGLSTALACYDEADKAGGSRTSGGHPYDILHGLLERSTASAWRSPYYLHDLNLGHVVHVLTANSTDPIPSSLLDRMTVVRVDEPGPEHLGLLAPALARQACRELGLDERWGDLDREELSVLQDAWRGGSVRRLQRMVARLLRARDSAPVARH
ncbi:hypothetical protein PQI07_16485 [Methylobacterium sp. 092160098-2]|uniref:hypothetical protein n=1 Tax=Methylobacterium sp. 092160098-2 TaxID=3025129 RepID=UPI00238193B7|nr:hypothetical protein [Methylobacterium sp. 092160098-2]MDE4912280.1 hypothetical protein [Methylobacterium sp. 092160098-2]